MSTLNQLLQERFPKGAIYLSYARDLDTLSEKRIRQMGWAIRSKQDWIKKLNDPKIVAKWKKEAKEQDLTIKEIGYVFEEVTYYQKLCGDGIVLSAVEQVWQSDGLIDAETLKKLKDYVKILEGVPDSCKDWHPNSNDQVLNLIHLPLYSIVYGRTSVLPEPISSPQAALEVKHFVNIPATIEDWDIYSQYVPDKVEEKEDFRKLWLLFYVKKKALSFLSRKFCWLPTEFMISKDGSVTIESYINNLHPVKHAKLYPAIANIFSKFVPMLEQVVTDLVHTRQLRVIPEYDNWYEYEEPQSEEPSDNEEWEEYSIKYREWWDSRKFIEPQPNKFVTPDRPLVPYSLRGRRLQAIVKMSNIQLTPDNPEYKGGSWHVESMGSERIIATGIYYYDVENITESRLTFREHLRELYSYEQHDIEGVEMAYRIQDLSNPTQDIGHVVAKQERCLMFPNVYQHQVSGFKLADLTKPGHRKILAFFFIDPSTTIPSTKYVPPQQQDWWTDKFINSKVNSLAQLPDLVKDNILKHVNFPISLKEAKKLRLELMAEYTPLLTGTCKSMFQPLIAFIIIKAQWEYRRNLCLKIIWEDRWES